jgi:aminoglycoside/choline kinase family phosphotransferase
LDTNFDKYFDMLNRDPRTICHGDFNISNVMFGKKDSIGIERICFIDWQTAFIGNGLVDLANLLYYSTDVSEFENDKDFETKIVKFYFKRLIRHGYNNSLGFENAFKTTTK